MNRRKFLKNTALLGAVAVVNFSDLGALLAGDKRIAQKESRYNLVIIMGGTPETMLDKMLDKYGGISRFVKKGYKVVLKPNIAWDKAPEIGATTNPLLVGAMVKHCMTAGAHQVLVFDHTCDNWAVCYTNSGIKKAVENAGGDMIPGNDANDYQEVQLPNGIKLKKTKIHQAIINCDVWFNMPVLKHHGGVKMTCSMNNYMGIVWDRDTLYKTDLEQCIADINTYGKKPALHIVDAYRVMKHNGPQGRAADDSVILKTLIASPDPIAADTASLKLLTQVRPTTLHDVSYIVKGENLNLGTTQLEKLKIARIQMESKKSL